MGCCPTKTRKSGKSRLNNHGTSSNDEEDEHEDLEQAVNGRRGNDPNDPHGSFSISVAKEHFSKEETQTQKPKHDLDDETEGDGKKKKKKKHETKNDVKLEVIIKSATNLRDADLLGKSDPYCVMEIPGRKKKHKVREQTEVIDDTGNPQWNHKFTFYCAIGDPLNFTIWDKDILTDEFLGRCTLSPSSYFPFGFSGELRLEETGEDSWAHLNVTVKVLEVPEEDHDIPGNENDRGFGGLWGHIDLTEPAANSLKADAVVSALEADMSLQKEETTNDALETLVRLAETGLHIPKQAIERVVACLHASDRRYRLAALAICKTLGNRCVPFAKDFGKVLNDNDEEVRIGACKIMGMFGDYASPYVETLGNLLLDEVPMVRSAALEALGVLSQADNLEALIVLGTCLRHKDNKYRLATCLILKALGVKATPHADLLVERIEHDSFVDVRIAACSTLGCLGPGANSVQYALVSLYYAEHDLDRRVGLAATEAIKKLKSEGRNLPARPAAGIGSEPRKAKQQDKNAKSKDDAKPKEKEVSKAGTLKKKKAASAM